MNQPPKRLVIVGGVAGGAATAARARRLSESAEIVLIEKGPDVSFANCGMPYHVSGEIADRSKLAVQTPESLRKLLNIQVHTLTEAIRMDRSRKVLVVRDLKSSTEKELPYDKLLLSPGASPIRPSLNGIQDPRVLTLRNLQDMDRIKERSTNARKIIVVGGGFIGLEMAESFLHLGKSVTLIEQMPQLLPQMDPEMTNQIFCEMVRHGAELILGDGLAGFETTASNITAQLQSGKRVEGDLVILSIGVKPDSQLAEQAGLKLGMRGAIVVNEFQQTSDPDIYAAGDAVETADPILGLRTSIPLGGPANRQGRVAADHIFLGAKAKPYPGSIGTAIVRVFDSAAGVTGYTEKRLLQNKVPFQATTVTAPQHASYFPGSVPLVLKILWSPEDGRILGAQATGADGVDKRLDVLSAAITVRMSVEDLCHLELSYAPPFGNARDVVNIAGFAAQNVRDGLSDPIHVIPADGSVQLLDVRPKAMSDLSPIAGAVAIPVDQLRGRLQELDVRKPIVTVCAVGKMSYFAQRILKQNGFNVKNHIGGVNLPNLIKNISPMKTCTSTPSSTNSAPLATVKLDACGLSCPGPIMKVKEAVEKLAPGQELVVTVSDPGFAKDLPSYCQATGMEFLGMESSKGIFTGRLKKPLQELAVTSSVPAGRNGATMVVFSCDMDKAMASLVIANGAAALGGQVTIFFTFWGLNVIRKEGPVEVQGKTFMDKMFGWMMPKGMGALPLSRMHMGGMGTAMMKGRMASKNLPNLPGLMADAKKAGVRMVACSMSMDAMGLKKEELLDGIEIGGVADFLNATRQTSANLFI